DTNGTGPIQLLPLLHLVSEKAVAALLFQVRIAGTRRSSSISRRGRKPDFSRAAPCRREEEEIACNHERSNLVTMKNLLNKRFDWEPPNNRGKPSPARYTWPRSPPNFFDGRKSAVFGPI